MATFNIKLFLIGKTLNTKFNALLVFTSYSIEKINKIHLK